MVAYTPYGTRAGPFKQYQSINFIEKNLDGINGEEIEPQFGMHVGRIYKWLLLCVKTRKDEITYRKSNRLKAIQQRDQLIQKEKERQTRLEQDLVEAEAKFAEEHKEEIEAALKWEQDQNGGAQNDDYGEEVDDDGGASAIDTRRQERPEMPVFNKEEFLKKWLEENPVIDIPPEYVPEVDADWTLTEEEEQTIINTFNASKSD